MHHDTWPTLYGALSGALLYLSTTGFAIPANRQGWCALLGSLALAAPGKQAAGVK